MLDNVDSRSAMRVWKLWTFPSSPDICDYLYAADIVLGVVQKCVDGKKKRQSGRWNGLEAGDKASLLFC
jgi:hypothetical protein